MYLKWLGVNWCLVRASLMVQGLQKSPYFLCNKLLHALLNKKMNFLSQVCPLDIPIQGSQLLTKVLYPITPFTHQSLIAQAITTIETNMYVH